MAASVPPLHIPPPLLLDTRGLARGIDNHHVDVLLSPRFRADLQQALTELLRQHTQSERSGADPSGAARERLFAPLRQSYQDMMTLLIQRRKAGLPVEAVNLLPFAVLRHLLQRSMAELKDHLNANKRHAANLHGQGSEELLRLHQHVAWLTRHFGELLLRLNETLLLQLHQVELQQLQGLRRQALGEQALDFAPFLRNPLLAGRDLGAPSFLVDRYLWWGGSAEDPGFARLNTALEALLGGLFPEAALPALLQAPADPPLPTEVFDDLGGLHALRPYLGPAEDCRGRVVETYGWLEHPANLQALFDLADQAETVRRARLGEGLVAGWRARRQLSDTRAQLGQVIRLLEQHEALLPLLASYQAAALRGRGLFQETDARLLCLCLLDQEPAERLSDPTLGGKALRPEEEEALTRARQTLQREARARRPETAARLLGDLARFRRQLKEARFAHRVFNRLALREEPRHIQLSRQAGTLYYLPTAAEVQESEARIAHHSILKADIRGSTALTAQFLAKGLNPASHFSLRFFEPINALLPVFGAAKVFIEGDAIILSFLEYESRPQDWLSVAQACGLARALLTVLHANNRELVKIGLPPLETGIGICYADEAPRFLFDGDHPIMISPAIGLADQLSSSSWKLRRQFDPAPFSVAELQLDENGQEEKGQTRLRYNVNGILLDARAFAKLSGETMLRRQQLRIDGEVVTLHSGSFYDRTGKRRSLVIREGRVGRWHEGQVLHGSADAPPFFEVVSNPRVLSLLRETQKREATALP